MDETLVEGPLGSRDGLSDRAVPPQEEQGTRVAPGLPLPHGPRQGLEVEAHVQPRDLDLGIEDRRDRERAGEHPGILGGQGRFAAGGTEGRRREGQGLDGLAHPFRPARRQHAAVAQDEGREQGLVLPGLAEEEGGYAAVEVVAQGVLHELQPCPTLGGGLPGRGLTVQGLQAPLRALLEELAEPLFDGRASAPIRQYSHEGQGDHGHRAEGEDEAGLQAHGVRLSSTAQRIARFSRQPAVDTQDLHR